MEQVGVNKNTFSYEVSDYGGHCAQAGRTGLYAASYAACLLETKYRV